MSENTADVVQGTLGWEPGDVSTASVNELTPHPKNEDIYGADEPAGDIAESVRENGVLEPLVIKSDKTIISGHRRWRAARNEGIEQVPVRIADFESELAEREALIEFNRQREKTPEQKMREAKELEAVERERAKDRQGTRTDLNSDDNEGNRHRATYCTKSRDEIAEKTGFGSGENFRRAEKVYDRAQEGDETAQEQWEQVNEGEQSVRGAYKTVQDEQRKREELEEAAESGDETAREQLDRIANGETSIDTAHKHVERERAAAETERQRTEPDETPARIVETDGREFIAGFDDGAIDLLLTDPPYGTEFDDLGSFVESWLPAALSKLSADGRAYVCIDADPGEIAAYYDAIDPDEFGEVQLLAWTYRNTIGQMPNRRYGRGWQAVLYLAGEDAGALDAPETAEQFSAMDITAPDGRHDGRHHRWQKPDELFERFIRHATDEGDLVVDPFAGSGTALLEAAKLGRHNRGAENDPETVKTALDRGCVRR